MMCLIAISSFILGVAISVTLIHREINRISELLENRNPSSTEKITVHLPIKFCERLVLAINNALDSIRQQIFEERRHNAELMKGFSELSHDIRTPLAAAKGHLQIIENEIETSAPNTSIHFQAAISRINTTSNILAQMLELTRATDPDQIYEATTIPLLPALISVLENHELEFTNQYLEPVLKFEDETICIEGNSEAFERVLENIISNSIKYGSSAPIFKQAQKNMQVILSISNEVNNPDEIDVHSIFRRFYRANNSRSGEGSGLGLPIAKALSEKMGMDLSAELQANTITFTLTMKALPSH